jgi:hypothetical protein
MEKMVSARLNWYLETQNLLPPTQAGFRRYCSTNQQIVILSQELKESRQKGNNACSLRSFQEYLQLHLEGRTHGQVTNNWCKRHNAQTDPQLYH